MFKRLAALLMIIVFLFGFSGCVGETEKTIPVYDETDMGTGLMARGIRVNSKDQLVVYTINDKGEAGYAILDKNGKQAGYIKSDFNGEGSNYTLDENDNLYVLAESYAFDKPGGQITEVARQLIIYDTKGVRTSSADLGKKSTDGRYMGLAGFETDSEGNVYLLEKFKSVEVFDKNGRSLGNIGSQGYSCMCGDPGGYLVLGSDGQGGGNNKQIFEKIKVPKGESAWKKDPGFNDIPRIIRYNRYDKNYYTITNQGVKKYDSSGKDLGYVLDLKQTGLSGFNTYISGMVMDSDGRFYITAMKSSGSGDSGQFGTVLYKYTPSKGGKADSNKTDKTIITLSAMETSSYLEDAIGEFQKKYPDIGIKVKVSPQISSQADFEKYITTLNTELMSDKGSDLISASQLPNYKYISKGVYANLSEIMAKDSEFNPEQYNTAIFDSFKYKGSMYVMPVSVFIETIAANKAILDEKGIKIDDTKWTWKEFFDICKKVTEDTNGDGTPERYALPNLRGDGIFGYMLNNNYMRFIDRENKKSYLDSPDFIGIMTLSKEFTDSKVSCPNEKAYYLNNELFDLYDRNGVVFIPATIYAYGTMGFFGGNTVFLQPPSIDGSYKPTYSTWLSLAINAKSKHKDEAWKFLKFLISKDMQAQWALNGFTPNKEATVIRREEEIERTKTGQSIGFGGRRVIPMTDTFLDMADRLVSIPGMMRDNDMQISVIISGEAGSYFAGKKSAEDAAKAMQNKMNIYLNE